MVKIKSKNNAPTMQTKNFIQFSKRTIDYLIIVGNKIIKCKPIMCNDKIDAVGGFALICLLDKFVYKKPLNSLGNLQNSELIYLNSQKNKIICFL